jgi:phosphoenolpyruvate carboxykinase (ATP)
MPKNVLFSLGLPSAENTFYQLSPDTLMQQCVERKEGVLDNTGAIVIHTEKYANHCSKNYFIVRDHITTNTIDWNDSSQLIEERIFDGLYQKMIEHLGVREIWIRDSYCADAASKLYIRSISEDPAGDLFVYNMFLHPTQKEIENFNPDWYIIHAPSFLADPKTDGTGQDNFIIINVTKRVILIGGLAYDNEIKEMIFSILNKPNAEG